MFQPLIYDLIQVSMTSGSSSMLFKRNYQKAHFLKNLTDGKISLLNSYSAHQKTGESRGLVSDLILSFLLCLCYFRVK